MEMYEGENEWSQDGAKTETTTKRDAIKKVIK